MTILISFFNGFAKLLKALWLFIAGIIAVGIIYYLLTGVEQGIDVVIQSGESLDSGVLSVLSVVLWSFLVWYSCRTLSYIRQHKDARLFSPEAWGDVTSAMLYKKYCIPSFLYRHIPRLLAYNCFVSIQVAIFHLPTFFSWSGLESVFAVLLHNIFYFILNAWYKSVPHTPRRKYLGLVCGAIIAAYITFIVYHIMEVGTGIDAVDHPLRHKFWLSGIALVMFLMQVGAVLLFILRRRSVDARRGNKNLQPSGILRIIGYNPEYNAAEAPWFNLLNGTAAVAVLVYGTAIFIMPFSSLMGPMAFTLLALGILTGFSNLLTLVSIRSSFNVMVILIGLAFFFGQYRDPYTVRLLETDRNPVFAKRPDTQQWLKEWFEKRLPLLDQSDSSVNFPVYIVLSNGGASRAGKWTGSVLGYLQDASSRPDKADSFKDHLLCIAGASGGSVGNCVFYSLLKASEAGQIRPDEFRYHTDIFFKTDFLTHTLARLLGPDIFRHLIPFNIPMHDRADALEWAMARGSADTLLNGYFQKPVSEIFDASGTLPALFINTTQVDNGMPGVIGSIRLPAISQRQDVLSLIDSMGIHHGRGDIRLSTATVLSSRFPYVSPAGKVFDRYYVDGGYFDNSGAGTVLEFIHALNRFMADSTQVAIAPYKDRFTFHILHITNSEIIRRPSGDIHPLTNDLLSPVLTLAGMQGSSTSTRDGILINAFKQINSDTSNAMILYSLYDETWDPAKNTGAYEEGYPMSWVLSDYQLSRIDLALERANRRNLRKFGFNDSPDRQK